MKYATIFGSSISKPQSKEYIDAIAISKMLVDFGYTVKCGGYGGVMEAASIGAKEAGGECIGVCLEYFERKREENLNLTHKIVAKDMFDRLRDLIEDSEIFIVFGGSIGTLNELFLVWCLKYIELNSARIIIIGRDYQKLKELDFIESKHFELLEFFDDIESFLRNFDAK